MDSLRESFTMLMGRRTQISDLTPEEQNKAYTMICALETGTVPWDRLPRPLTEELDIPVNAYKVSSMTLNKQIVVKTAYTMQCQQKRALSDTLRSAPAVLMHNPSPQKIIDFETLSVFYTIGNIIGATKFIYATTPDYMIHPLSIRLPIEHLIIPVSDVTKWIIPSKKVYMEKLYSFRNDMRSTVYLKAYYATHTPEDLIQKHSITFPANNEINSFIQHEWMQCKRHLVPYWAYELFESILFWKTQRPEIARVKLQRSSSTRSLYK